MEIIKAAHEWAKAEIVSSKFLMLFGVIYLIAAIGFWMWGNSDLTKTLFIPLVIAGGLLLAAGIGFYTTNKAMLSSFETKYKTDPTTLIDSEITRTTKTIKTYENVALRVFPIVLIVALFLFLFISHPLIRSICIAIVAFLAVLIILDSQALKRMKVYKQQLEIVEHHLKN